MVKPEKARGIEDMLIRMAKTGQLKRKVTEDDLVEMLHQISRQEGPKTKIVVGGGVHVANLRIYLLSKVLPKKYNRRRDDDDEDDI